MNEYIKINPVGGGSGGAVTSSLIPNSDGLLDVGDGTHQFNTLYVSNGIKFLNTGPQVIAVDSTHLLIQAYDTAFADVRGTIQLGPNDGDCALNGPLNDGAIVEAFAIRSYAGSGTYSPTLQFFAFGTTGEYRLNNTAGGIQLVSAGDPGLTVDSNATATETRLLLWDVDAASLVRVSVGANDSGGIGYKLLLVPNS